MRPQHFAITRAVGRSNSQVILDTVKQAEPGRLFSYRELTEALSIGTGHVYDHRAVCSAVRAATTRLLHEAQRRLPQPPIPPHPVAPPSPASPSPAAPCLAAPRRATPASPRPAQPSHALPRHACLGRPLLRGRDRLLDFP